MLAEAIDNIDRESGISGISLDRYNDRRTIDVQLQHIRKEEHVTWYERAKDTDLIQDYKRD